MEETYREMGFDGLVAVASAVIVTAYMLGVVFDPLLAAAVGLLLVLGGAATLVPPRARATAAAIGGVAVGVAGVAVPRAVESVVVPPAGNELAIALAASGLVLLLSFALLRLTAFRDRDERPA